MSALRTFALALTLPAVLAASQARAAAGPRRLVTIERSPLVDRSLARALSAWTMDVIVVDAPTPPADGPEAVAEGRTIARAHDVEAVAWLVDAGDARTLVLYDAGADRILSREVGGGEIDESTAAAIALSLKSMLRAMAPSPSPESVPKAAVAPPPAPSEDRAADSLRLEVGAGMRARPADRLRFDPSAGAGVVWWPKGLRGRLGAEAHLDVAWSQWDAPSEISTRTWDFGVSAFAHTRLTPARRFAIDFALGGGVHVTQMSVFGATAPSASFTYADPVLETSLAPSLALGSGVEIGLRAGVLLWLLRQEYSLRGRYVDSALGPAEASGGVVVGAPLY
jgi:DNA-binding NarL/FixJ family response regulator